MSSEGMAWAIRCDVKAIETKNSSSSVKNMLMIVSDLANHVTGEVYASNEYYQRASGLAKKTVIGCFDDLVGMGVLEETPERRGKTGQIPVYLFHMPEGLPQIPRYSTRKTGAKTHPLQKGDRKGVQIGSERGADLPGKEGQIDYTEPRRGNQEEEQTPPTPDGVGAPTGGLFGDDLPEVPKETPIDEFVLDGWIALKAQHPGIADITALSPARVKAISARASDAVKARKRMHAAATPESIWREIFDQIGRSRFLTGRAPPGPGRTSAFKLTIDYVLRQKEFFRILDGGYDDGNRHGPGISYDDRSGRQYGPAEQAGRRALERL